MSGNSLRKVAIHRDNTRNLADLTARIPDLDRAMRGLLARERQAAANSLSGLESAGVLKIEPVEKELLIDNMLLSLTYWIPYSDLTDPNALANGSAQTSAIARLMLMVAPHLDGPERNQFTAIARKYLDIQNPDQAW